MTDNIRISITKDQIANLPIESFKGDIKLVDSPSLVSEAIDRLMQHPIIGFDTETKPSFKKGRTNKVALMQLSTPDCCYLFRLNMIGIGDDLRRLLEDDSITKIGLSIHDDFNVMHRSSQVNPRGFVELQSFVKDYGIIDISLQKIFAILFGQRISKGQRLTNWEAPELTRQQMTYAATDAWACLKIYHYLTNGNFDPTGSPYIVVDQPEQSSEQNTSEQNTSAES